MWIIRSIARAVSSRFNHMILFVTVVILFSGLYYFIQPKVSMRHSFSQSLMSTPAETRYSLSATSDPTKNFQINKTRDSTYQQRLPHFIIIGVMKCGTTALNTFLKMHPDVVTTSTELHFFDNDQAYGYGLDWHKKEMPYSYPDQLTGERAPHYYKTPAAPERIHSMNSSVKLILVVKEPVERTMSQYLQRISIPERDDGKTFDDLVLTSDGEVNPKAHMVKISDYNLFIDNWLRYFSLEQIKVVDGQRLVEAPHEVLAQVQEFLGLRPYINKSFFKYNKEKGFYCYRTESGVFTCFDETKGRPHLPMSTDTRSKLRSYFNARNKMFYSKIGQTFDW